MANQPEMNVSKVNDGSPRVLVLGAGAIGAFYGHALSLGGADVSVVCRSEYQHVKNNGFELLSKERGDVVFRPSQVLQSALDYQGAFPDFLVVSVKVVHGSDRVSHMNGAVGPNTVIVLIENGVEIEQEIAQAFPKNQMISCLAFVQVSRLSPGVIRHYAYGDLTMGNFPCGVSDECKQFSKLLAGGNIKAPLTENVVNARWQKCLWNAPFNPVSVLGGPIDTRTLLALPEGEKLIRDLMAELAAVAASTGNPMPEGLIDQYINVTNAAPAYKTSMALDCERGAAMEIEAILGNAVRVAYREGVAIPKLEAIYALMKMFEVKK
jgi:2-dehydropantoate 2-reductase